MTDRLAPLGRVPAPSRLRPAVLAFVATTLAGLDQLVARDPGGGDVDSLLAPLKEQPTAGVALLALLSTLLR